MTDTARSLADIKTLLADNASGQISPQDLRDAIESIVNPVPGGGFDAIGAHSYAMRDLLVQDVEAGPSETVNVTFEHLVAGEEDWWDGDNLLFAPPDGLYLVSLQVRMTNEISSETVPITVTLVTAYATTEMHLDVLTTVRGSMTVVSPADDSVNTVSVTLKNDGALDDVYPDLGTRIQLVRLGAV